MPGVDEVRRSGVFDLGMVADAYEVVRLRLWADDERDAADEAARIERIVRAAQAEVASPVG